MEMLANIDEETVDFQPNYDGKNQEPLDGETLSGHAIGSPN